LEVRATPSQTDVDVNRDVDSELPLLLNDDVDELELLNICESEVCDEEEHVDDDSDPELELE